MEHQNSFNPHYVEIPKIFWSDLTGQPMEKCVSCDTNLLQGEPYLVEKAIRKYKNGSHSTIFEYAMCYECAIAMRSVLSESSKKRIDAFFEEKVNMEERRNRLMKNENPALEDYMGCCLVNGTSSDEVEEYQIFGECIGDKMVMLDFPYMISGAVIDEIGALLSPETLEDLNNFKNSIIDPSPEFLKLLDDPRVLV